jgi:hypothetical protein
VRIIGQATALAVVAALAVGCGGVVEGTAKPAPNLKPRPLTGETLNKVLLDDTALSTMLGQPFVARKPAEFGGPDKLDQREAVSSPAGCLGVTSMLNKSVYQSPEAARAAQITGVALESWWNNGEPAQVITVMEGVVALTSAEQARALFADFSEQWQKCNGATTTEHAGPINTTNVVSDVRVAGPAEAAGPAGSIVTATNTATSVLPNMPALEPTPQGRALGVRLNCIVEVGVVFFGGRRPSDPGSANLETSAAAVARVMLDKVSALS